MLVAMSTQLLSGPSPGPEDAHPFTDAAMVQVKKTKFYTMLNLMSFVYYCFVNLAVIVYAGRIYSWYGRSQAAT